MQKPKGESTRCYPQQQQQPGMGQLLQAIHLSTAVFSVVDKVSFFGVYTYYYTCLLPGSLANKVSSFGLYQLRSSNCWWVFRLMLLLLLYCCCCCAVTRSCVRSIKHKTRNSLLRRVVLRDASRVEKQPQHSSSTAAAQERRRRWRRRGSSSGQFPFGVSGWLLCCVSVAERVCALSVCVHIWLSLVALVARFRPRDKARSV